METIYVIMEKHVSQVKWSRMGCLMASSTSEAINICHGLIKRSDISIWKFAYVEFKQVGEIVEVEK